MTCAALARPLTVLAAVALLAGCATPSAPRVLVRTEHVEVPVLTPVPVSPSDTDAAAPPTLPARRLSNDDLVQHIKALDAYACTLRAQLARIARVHGSGTAEVDCEAAP